VDPSRLAAIPLFAGLDEATLAALAGAATETDAETGTVVAAEADFGHALYAIESGTAKVVADGATVRALGPGDVFGEIAILSGGRRTASVVATSPLRLITLFKRDVWALERQAPEAAAALRRLIDERLASQAQPPTLRCR
jgi:CRP-like cAMP-binding protein